MERLSKCPICRKDILGRSDKKYCSNICKASYHRRLRFSTSRAAQRIDKILHRNRSILIELMGKNRRQIKIPLIELEQTNFNFSYITKYHTNKEGKKYHYVYDFAYMTFSNDEVLIIRTKR